MANRDFGRPPSFSSPASSSKSALYDMLRQAVINTENPPSKPVAPHVQEPAPDKGNNFVADKVIVIAQPFPYVPKRKPEPKTKPCVDCGNPISKRATRCMVCANRARLTPEAIEKMKATLAANMSDPERRDQIAAAKKANWADPEWKARNVEAVRRGMAKARERRAQDAKRSE